MRAQFLRFAIVGVIGFVVDAGVLSLLLHAGFGYFGGRAVSFLAAVWTTWRLNRRYTFDPRPAASPWREWGQYLVAMSFGGCLNYAAYSASVLLLPKTPYLPVLSVAVGSVAGLAANFVSARWWVFRQRPTR